MKGQRMKEMLYFFCQICGKIIVQKGLVMIKSYTKRFGIVFLFLGLIGCLPGPTEEELKGSRFFDQAVVQVELTGVTQDFDKLAIEIELASGKRLKTKSDSASPRSASFALVMPDSIQYSDIKRLAFRLPGFKPLDVEYGSIQKEKISPPERKVKGVNSFGRCEDQLIFSPPEPEFEFAKLLLLSSKANASSYTYECTITFREREKIKVSLEQEQP
jgi:hypothetical protein